MMAYFLQLSGYTLLFYSVYALLLKKQPYAQLSRVFLWLTIVLPFVLPFLKFSWPQAVAKLVPAPLMQYLPEVVFQAGGQTTGFNGTALILLFYAAIALFLLFKSAGQWWRFRQLLQRAEKMTFEGVEIALLPLHGPGSFGRFIFFPDKEINPEIFRHELAHVQQRHDADLMLLRFLRAVCWPHFLLYFLEKELRLVHEYAADRAAVGHHSESYVQLLLAQAFGVNHPFIHTFFHYPLKQRIMMLQQETKTKNRRGLTIKASFSIIMLSGLIVFAQCRNQEKEPGRLLSTVRVQAQPIDNPSDQQSAQSKRAQQILDSYNSTGNKQPAASVLVAEKPGSNPAEAAVQQPYEGMEKTTPLAPQSNTPDSPLVYIYKYVDQMAEFDGPVSDWLGRNLRYPEQARKENKSGRVITQFVVSSTGEVQDAVIVKSSGVPELDEEAIRVIRAMPPWKPGKQNGKAVAVYYTLPILFTLGK